MFILTNHLSNKCLDVSDYFAGNSSFVSKFYNQVWIQ